MPMSKQTVMTMILHLTLSMDFPKHVYMWYNSNIIPCAWCASWFCIITILIQTSKCIALCCCDGVMGKVCLLLVVPPWREIQATGSHKSSLLPELVGSSMCSNRCWRIFKYPKDHRAALGSAITAKPESTGWSCVVLAQQLLVLYRAKKNIYVLWIKYTNTHIL